MFWNACPGLPLQSLHACIRFITPFIRVAISFLFTSSTFAAIQHRRLSRRQANEPSSGIIFGASAHSNMLLGNHPLGVISSFPLSCPSSPSFFTLGLAGGYDRNNQTVLPLPYGVDKDPIVCCSATFRTSLTSQYPVATKLPPPSALWNCRKDNRAPFYRSGCTAQWE